MTATVAVAYVTNSIVSGTDPFGKPATYSPGQIVPVGATLTSVPAGTNLSAFNNPSGNSSISLQSDQMGVCGGTDSDGDEYLVRLDFAKSAGCVWA